LKNKRKEKEKKETKKEKATNSKEQRHTMIDIPIMMKRQITVYQHYQ